jgi:hypothetical protein
VAAAKEVHMPRSSDILPHSIRAESMADRELDCVRGGTGPQDGVVIEGRRAGLSTLAKTAIAFGVALVVAVLAFLFTADAMLGMAIFIIAAIVVVATGVLLVYAGVARIFRH